MKLVAVIVPPDVIEPVTLIEPVPLICWEFMSSVPPNCGVPSSTKLFMPLTIFPPTVEPSPVNIFFVSVV